MIRNLKNFTLFDGAVVLFLMLASGIGTNAIVRYADRDYTIPVVITKSEALTPVIKSGKPVLARVWRTKNRDDCPLKTNARLVRPDGSSWYPDNPQKSITSFIPDSGRRQGEVGTDYVDVVYNVQTAPVGFWTLTQRLTYTCPDRTFVIEQPPFTFEIQP